ncbi:Aldo-keto reductase, partial [Operophtera brumata]
YADDTTIVISADTTEHLQERIGIGGREELKGNEVEEAVEAAIDAGYRHVDTAAIYSTEEQLWNDKHAKDAVVPALKESLAKLNLQYVDMYLIHWPVAFNVSITCILSCKGAVGSALSESLAKLNLQYVDMYLIHWPVALNVSITCSLSCKGAVVPALRESLAKLNLQYVDMYLIHWPVALNVSITCSLSCKGAVVPALRESLAKLNLQYVDMYLIHWAVALNVSITCSVSCKGAVVPALRESLAKLNLQYVDMYLILACRSQREYYLQLVMQGCSGAGSMRVPRQVEPAADRSLSDTDYLETWQGMTEALHQGLTRSIGVSNFNQRQLERLNITVTGYTPFGSLFYSKAAEDAPPPRVDEPALQAIADKYNKTVPQITLRYMVELGVVPIPKSVTRSRIEQNLDVFDFTLTQQERDLLKSYDRNYRTIPVKNWITSPYYPFEK